MTARVGSSCRWGNCRGVLLCIEGDSCGVALATKSGVAVGIGSKCAGLSRSTAIVSLCPFTSMVKYLGLWSSTLKGPLYGGCSGLRTPSCLMKTYELFHRISLRG